jgi:hypothetical protein
VPVITAVGTSMSGSISTVRQFSRGIQLMKLNRPRLRADHETGGEGQQPAQEVHAACARMKPRIARGLNPAARLPVRR